MLKKAEGAAHIIILCFMGLILLFFYMLAGFMQLQIEYATTRLNESVSEAILAADYIDQYLSVSYGYAVFDCSPTASGHCNFGSCLYETSSETAAYNMAYNKAKKRFDKSLTESLSLDTGYAVTDRTPCGVVNVELKDFRTYSVIDPLGKDILTEGETYMKTQGTGQWLESSPTPAAPNGDTVARSGIYADVEFEVRTVFQTTQIPVRIFVGIRQ